MTANHTTISGPNTRPMPPVPLLCTRKSASRMTRAMGSTYGVKSGVATPSPSTAESTETAGVMTPSP